MATQEWLQKDYYKVLGVPKTADADTIKKAYRTLAKQLHPDQHAQDGAKAEKAAERFKDVTEAYDVLGDANKRKEYDQMRSLGGRIGGFARGPGAGRPTAGSPPPNFGDVLGGQGLGDIFSSLFNSRSQPAARRGADVESDVEIDLADALAGVTVPVRMASGAACAACHGTGAKQGSMPRVCPTCDGKGNGAGGGERPCPACRGRGLVVDEACGTCHGSGRATEKNTIQARIPAGVRDGQRIRVRGKGAPGERGGRAGDLYLSVKVRPHSVFGRTDDNLTLTVPVTFVEAALGADISVPTWDGSVVKVRLAAGTPNGRVIRMRGRGAKRADGSRGDLLVTIEVVVPADLSDDARRALETYARLSAGADPRAALVARARAARTGAQS